MLEQAIARGRTTAGPDQPNEVPIVMVKQARGSSRPATGRK
jgi:hypothetical protein